MEKENENLLVEGAKAFGIRLDGKAVEAFDLYLQELLKWNRKINLTAIRSEKGIVIKHFLDSLSALPHLSGRSSLLDIGSGAGFPGIPLKMVRPSLEITLIDSVRKKVDFQRHITRALALKGIETIHGRAQEREIIERMEGRFEAVISRAFSGLEPLLGLSYPFLRKGGVVLAMRGEAACPEMEPFPKAEGLRFIFKNRFDFELPFTSFKRSILLFEKE